MHKLPQVELNCMDYFLKYNFNNVLRQGCYSIFIAKYLH